MTDKAKSGLQHVPATTGLATPPMRSGLIARGRRDAAGAAANPHYREAVALYNARNYPAAAEAFRLSAESGHAESQYLLSTLLDAGQGVRPMKPRLRRGSAAPPSKGTRMRKRI